MSAQKRPRRNAVIRAIMRRPYQVLSNERPLLVSVFYEDRVCFFVAIRKSFVNLFFETDIHMCSLEGVLLVSHPFWSGSCAQGNIALAIDPIRRHAVLGQRF